MLKNFTKADILFLIAALISLVYAELLYFGGNKEDGLFVGLWVPTILSLSIFLKLLKKR
ncbi:MAG: hypothetical protein JNL75_04620 [Chitinophagales bacterium]|nr:hypothetical protein [Chitinophagales bacterium]